MRNQAHHPTAPWSHFRMAVPAALVFLAFVPQSMLFAADYYPPRVSFIDGRGSYEPAGDVDWDEVTVSLPLLSGDRIFAQPDSRIEVDLGKANFLRLGPETDVVFVQVAEKETVLELHEGDLILRINDSERHRVYTPDGPVFINKKGLYRISAGPGRTTEVFVRKGKAEIETARGKRKVETGQRALLDTRSGGIVDIAYGYYDDEFDRWSDRRDARFVSSQSVAYVGGYYPGVYDLDYYGSWAYYPAYGRVWIPRVSVGWVPFRLGHWLHFSFGWTWVSYEPWGWMPYHYGNWIYYSNNWCWVPGGFHSWAPGPVDFFYGHGYVGWFPRGHWNRGFVNNYINNTVIINNTTVINEASRRGITVVRENDFGRTRINDVAVNRFTTNQGERLREGLPSGLQNPVSTRARGRSIDLNRDRGQSFRSPSRDPGSGIVAPGGRNPVVGRSGSSRSEGVETRSSDRSVDVRRTPSRTTRETESSGSRETIRSQTRSTTQAPRAPSTSRDREVTRPSVAPRQSGAAERPRSSVTTPPPRPERRPEAQTSRPPSTPRNPDNLEQRSSSSFRSRPPSVSTPAAPQRAPSITRPEIRRDSAPPRTLAPATRSYTTERPLSRSVPSRSPNATSIGRPLPSVSRSTPSINRSAPSVSRAPATSGRSAPSFSRSAPSPGRSMPSYSRPAPSIGRSAPSMPSVGRSAPSAPSIQRSAPAPSRPSASRPSRPDRPR